MSRVLENLSRVAQNRGQSRMSVYPANPIRDECLSDMQEGNWSLGLEGDREVTM